MGYRFNKRINCGLGFRINISKNGIGYSWGAPGYRISHKANGGVRKTYSIPGTGLSYIEEQSNKNNMQSQSQNFDNNSFTPVINGKINAITTEDNKIFVSSVKNVLVKNFWTWFVSLFITALIPSIFANFLPQWAVSILFYSFIALSILISCLLMNKRKIVLDYEIDDYMKTQIESRNSAFEILSKTSKIWKISNYQSISYTRVQAGCSTNIGRSNANFVLAKLPNCLKSVNKEDRFYQLKLGSQKYIFLPDKILVLGFFKAAALSYHDIEISLSTTPFVETGIKPADAPFLYNTWQYVNNNGTPDRRFSNNRQLPVYEYAKIYLKSQTGLNVHILVSNSNKAEEFKNKFDNIEKTL